MMWDWRKSQKSMELMCSVQYSSQNENIVNTSKILLKTRYWTFPLEQCFTWNLKFFSYTLSMVLVTRSWCVMLYSWPRVIKCWLSMTIHFKQRCVIDSLLTNTFHYVKEVNVWDNKKCFQDIKNIKLYSGEKGLLEIRPNQCKGWQHHLTENVLQDVLPS